MNMNTGMVLRVHLIPRWLMRYTYSISTVYSENEFIQKLQAGHHFLNTVMKESKILLIGDEDVLAGLVEERLAD